MMLLLRGSKVGVFIGGGFLLFCVSQQFISSFVITVERIETEGASGVFQRRERLHRY